MRQFCPGEQGQAILLRLPGPQLRLGVCTTLKPKQNDLSEHPSRGMTDGPSCSPLTSTVMFRKPTKLYNHPSYAVWKHVQHLRGDTPVHLQSAPAPAAAHGNQPADSSLHLLLSHGMFLRCMDAAASSRAGLSLLLGDTSLYRCGTFCLSNDGHLGPFCSFDCYEQCCYECSCASFCVNVLRPFCPYWVTGNLMRTS